MGSTLSFSKTGQNVAVSRPGNGISPTFSPAFSAISIDAPYRLRLSHALPVYCQEHVSASNPLFPPESDEGSYY